MYVGSVVKVLVKLGEESVVGMFKPGTTGSVVEKAVTTIRTEHN